MPTMLMTSLGALALAALLGGCAALPGKTPAQAPVPVRSSVGPATVAGPADMDVPIQKIPFRTGVSSATVERMARQQACTGGQGAGLITEPGPVEVYRMQCDGGKVFMARCEMRQCRPM